MAFTFTSTAETKTRVTRPGSVNKPFFQPKLSINQPGDEYEQEADAVADKVMRMTGPEIEPFFSPGSGIQRKCAHYEEEEKKGQVRRKVENFVVQRQDRNPTPATPTPAPALAVPAAAAPAVTPPATPTATPGTTTATPSATPSPLATPEPTREASAGDALGAVMAIPQVIRLVQEQKQRLLQSLTAAWTDTSLFGKFFALATALGLGSGLAMAIYSSRNNPAALDFFVSPLSGSVLQIPAISALPAWTNAVGLEVNFDRTNPNSSVRNQMVGVHFDVGRFLPAPLGFGPVDSFAPIGAPPSMSRKTNDERATGVPSEDVAGAENYIGSINGKGENLSAGEKTFFGDRIGYDFSNVRIHKDSAANESAKSINALAYTTGSDIVFGANQYEPATCEGRKLIAHELTHVVQQSNKVQRAPAPATPAVTNWWDDKSIGVKPSAKFWQDVNLFFPKDARKFSGSGMENIQDIDCDDNGLVKIGKGFWEETDGLKRKASIATVIEKRDVKRYDDGRIDNEDLTNDKIASKLKALSGDDLKSYVSKLSSFSTVIKNDQVIAYLNGDDKAKTAIIKDATDKLLDWKFDNNRLTDADFSDERINTRLRGLSTADKLAKEQKAKEFAKDTGEDTAKLQSFLHTQTLTSTPLPDGATVDSLGGFTMSFPNMDIIVLPDTSGGKGNDTSFTTNLPTTSYQYSGSKATGLITEFFRMDGKTKIPVAIPSKVVVTIQTRFSDLSNVDQTSAYGRGTTAQDIQWGGKTLRFHEGSHGKGFIDSIRSHNWPSLAIGSVKPTDLQDVNDWMKQMNVESCDLVDQVGITQKDFAKTPEGIASGIVSCK